MKLCTCNNCERVFEDPNPETGAKDYPDNDYVLSLEKLFDDESNPETGYWGCPVCHTDECLSDFVEQFHPLNSDDVLTKADFLEIAKGNQEYADILWDRRDWAHPATMVDEDLREGEIIEVNGTYLITHGEENY